MQVYRPVRSSVTVSTGTGKEKTLPVKLWRRPKLFDSISVLFNNVILDALRRPFFTFRIELSEAHGADALLIYTYIWAWQADLIPQDIFADIASTVYRKNMIFFISYSTYIMLIICYGLSSISY
jgi:hypothetical protein